MATAKSSIKQENIESMAAYPNLPFSFFSCPVVRYRDYVNAMYLIGVENQSEARKAILGLNAFLLEAKKENPWFVAAEIEPKHIRFFPSNINGIYGDDCTFFELNPRTKTGKLTKYPLTMQVRTLSYEDDWAASQTDNIVRIHGKIDYLASGEIGRIVLYCLEGTNCFTLKWDKNKGFHCELSVN